MERTRSRNTTATILKEKKKHYLAQESQESQCLSNTQVLEIFPVSGSIFHILVNGGKNQECKFHPVLCWFL